MQYRQGTVLETLRRTQGYLDAHADLVGDVNKSGARRDLDAIASELPALAVSQDGHDRGSVAETAKQQSLRQALRQTHMRPIAEIARQKLRTVPEFTALRMPPGNVTANLLAAKAGGMADAATLHAQVFIDGGLDPDFVNQLRTAAGAVSKSVDGRAAHRGVRAGSTRGLAAAEKAGRAVLRVLDSIVRPKLGADEKALGEWISVSRIPRKTFTGGSSKPAVGTPAVVKPVEAKPATTAVSPTPAPVVAGSTTPPPAEAVKPSA